MKLFCFLEKNDKKCQNIKKEFLIGYNKTTENVNQYQIKSVFLGTHVCICKLFKCV